MVWSGERPALGWCCQFICYMPEGEFNSLPYFMAVITQCLKFSLHCTFIWEHKEGLNPDKITEPTFYSYLPDLQAMSATYSAISINMFH